MHYGIVRLARDSGGDVKIQELETHLFDRLAGQGCSYHAYWWWTSIVWATAAVAIHNLQQQGKRWPGCRDEITPLTLSEDPLAYLGILVDVLQEWDRYTVFRTSIFTGKLPLQGKDVRLGTDNGIVLIDYGSEDRAKKVREALNTSLQGWDQVVSVLPKQL